MNVSASGRAKTQLCRSTLEQKLWGSLASGKKEFLGISPGEPPLALQHRSLAEAPSVGPSPLTPPSQSTSEEQEGPGGPPALTAVTETELQQEQPNVFQPSVELPSFLQ